jgi:hypothetical protein
MKWPIKLPIGKRAEELIRLSGDVVEICLPLSPTKNVWVRLHPMAQHRYGKQVYDYAWMLSRLVLAPRDNWADRVRVSTIRCSEGRVQADTANVIAGCEKHYDAIVRAGWVKDDDPKHFELGETQDRTKGKWGDYAGPGTWLRIERIA